MNADATVLKRRAAFEHAIHAIDAASGDDARDSAIRRALQALAELSSCPAAATDPIPVLTREFERLDARLRHPPR